MFKIGDKVVLSPGGIKYLSKECPSILPQWINTVCEVRHNFWSHYDCLGVYRQPNAWMEANPDHFQLFADFEYEEIDV